MNPLEKITLGTVKKVLSELPAEFTREDFNTCLINESKASDSIKSRYLANEVIYKARKKGMIKEVFAGVVEQPHKLGEHKVGFSIVTYYKKG